jgi:hypothetical protein
VLRCQHASGFHLKGAITLDGSGVVTDLVQISLLCPGLTLEDLNLKNFARSAIAVVNGAGNERQPIRLVNLTVHGAVAGKDKTPGKPAVFLDAKSSIEGVPKVDYLEILGLRVEGLSVRDAVQKRDNDASVAGSHITIGGKE